MQGRKVKENPECVGNLKVWPRSKTMSTDKHAKMS